MNASPKILLLAAAISMTLISASVLARAPVNPHPTLGWADAPSPQSSNGDFYYYDGPERPLQSSGPVPSPHNPNPARSQQLP